MQDPIYQITLVEQKCERCNGIGWIRQFDHVEGGICFKCRGNGSNTVVTKSISLRTSFEIGDKVAIREGEGIIRNLQKVTHGTAVEVEIKNGTRISLLASKEIRLIA